MAELTTPADLAGAVYEAAVQSKAAKLKATLAEKAWRDAKTLERVYMREFRGNPNFTVRNEMDTLRADLETEYAWIEPVFRRYLSPDPDAMNEVIDTLESLAAMFGVPVDDAHRFGAYGGGLTKIWEVYNDLGSWKGSFQENFTEKFLNPLRICRKQSWHARQTGTRATAVQQVDVHRTPPQGDRTPRQGTERGGRTRR